MNGKNILYWACRLVAAAIMAQTLYFKFTGAPESVAIFTQMGIEPWGRYGTGVVELIASLLLLANSTARWGALVACGTMAGAIGSHLLVLGIESQGDGGYLFTLACVVMVCSLYILWVNKEELLKLFAKIKG
jgi:putative oxidoreductase